MGDEKPQEHLDWGRPTEYASAIPFQTSSFEASPAQPGGDDASLFQRVEALHDRVFGSASLQQDSYAFVFSRATAAGSALILCVAAALPSEGAGIPLCPFKALTGLPCPGCGLTRAFSSLLHGQFAKAFTFHPFAFLLVPVAFWMAAQLVLPAGLRDGQARWFRRHDRILRFSYLTFIYGFIGFGIVRLVWFALWGLPPI